MKILIAEDEPKARELLKKTLEDWGHEVLVAANGLEAWNIFQKENVKLVIADWIMPEMEGTELCRNIRKSETSGYVYCILLTSRDGKEHIVEGLEAGADDYVIKPFEKAEFKVRLRAGERIINLEKTLSEKNRTLEELSLIDPLMEIGNRRHFYATIERMQDRAIRYNESYGVIMCDVDLFKKYNDTYGHLPGDQLLKDIATSIKRSCRNSDEIFRYGGEEIVILVPGQNLDGAAVVAGKIRQGIESLNIAHRGSDKGIVTISCGVSAYTPEDHKLPWENLLDRADKALYKAKTNGRNQVRSEQF